VDTYTEAYREELRRTLFGRRDFTGDNVVKYLERHRDRTFGDAMAAVAFLHRHPAVGTLEAAGEAVLARERC
jgi:hypothetical protein